MGRVYGSPRGLFLRTLLSKILSSYRPLSSKDHGYICFVLSLSFSEMSNLGIFTIEHSGVAFCTQKQHLSVPYHYPSSISHQKATCLLTQFTERSLLVAGGAKKMSEGLCYNLFIIIQQRSSVSNTHDPY